MLLWDFRFYDTPHWRLKSCPALKNVPPISKWAALSASERRPTVSCTCSRMLNWSWRVSDSSTVLAISTNCLAYITSMLLYCPVTAIKIHWKPIILHPKRASGDGNGNKWIYKTQDLPCGCSSKSSGPQWQLRVAHLTQHRRSRSHL